MDGEGGDDVLPVGNGSRAGEGGGGGGGGTEYGDAVMQLMSVLGDEITESKAARLVEMSGGDVNLAISLHFDSLAEGSGGEGDSGDGGAVAPRNAADGSESPSSADEPQDPAGVDLLVAHEGPGPSRINSNSTAGGSVMRRSSSLDDHLSSPMRNGTRRPSAPAVEPTPGLGFDDDDAAVLVQHADGLPDLPQARRSGARPGTAQPSRRLEQDEHDMISKKEAIRSVIGPDVDDALLEHLLRSTGMDVQSAIEAYFDAGVLPVAPPPRREALSDQAGSERSAPTRAQPSAHRQRMEHGGEGEEGGEEEVGPRRPFVDLCGMIGNGITPSVLGPLMVETEGDVSKALELYSQRRRQEGGLPPASPDDNLSAEMYYLRPEKPVPVICNVYDLCWGQDKEGKKKKTNSGLAGVGLGVYHSGIEVFGREISFGFSDDASTGVFEVPGKCAAGVMPNITFKEGVVMGTLNRSRFELDHLLRRLAAKYRGDTYDLVRRNCNHFANELCVCLVGKKIPSYINRPANMGRVLLNTIQVPAMAFGKIIDGVKGGKKKDQQGAGGQGRLVVAAPDVSGAAAAAGSARNESGNGRGAGGS